MATLRDQLKQAQIEKGQEELRALKLRNKEEEGLLLDSKELEHDMARSLNELRSGLQDLRTIVVTHLAYSHGGVMVREIENTVRDVLADWHSELSKSGPPPE